MQFRQFKEEDWGDFNKLSTEAFPSDSLKRNIYLSNLDNEGFVGAYVDAKLVGILLLRLMGSYAHLGQIAVTEGERGKGYGKQLMDYSINYFKENNIKTAGLYVETKNDIALNLYHKYGFAEKHESWHYWINEEEVKEIEGKEKNANESLRVLNPDDYESIVNIFPQINVEELKMHLEKYQESPVNTSIPLGLFVKGQIKVYGRFNAIFSGCRPFYCTNVKYVDEFLRRLSQYREEKKYYRITFEKNENLARFFDSRKYNLHHHMWIMEKNM